MIWLPDNRTRTRAPRTMRRYQRGFFTLPGGMGIVRAPGGGGGGGGTDPHWANVVFLGNFDGPNGSTALIDSSAYARTISALGDAQISTAQSVSGGASLSLGGTGRVTSAAASSLSVGTQDFTLEGWLRTTTKNRAILDLRPVATPGFYFGVAATTGVLQAFCNSGSSSIDLFGATDVCDGNWHAYYFSRVAGVMYFGVDGAADGNGAQANNVTQWGQLTVGAVNNNTFNFVGNIDEMRLTIGVGRYTGHWTPSAPFPKS